MVALDPIEEPSHTADRSHTTPRHAQYGDSSLGRAGFESASDIYERARPSYPADAVSFLVERASVSAGTRVLDIAAGTGKLTRQLVPFGAHCVALEPSPSMREIFGRVVPGVPIVGGTAEQLPFADQSIDVVVIAQAFHWFDQPRALAEIDRVLRPKGTVAAVWNERDPSDPMVAELIRLSKWDTEMPYPEGMDFGPIIDACGRFGPVARTKFTFQQMLSRDEFVDQVASRSYVRVLDEVAQAALLGQVADQAAALDEPIAMPYITDLFMATKLG